MSERQDLARRLVLQKAILDLLRELDAETRTEARSLYTVGSADGVEDAGGAPLGRVQMRKGTARRQVVDYAALTAWAAEKCPQALVPAVSLSTAWVAQVLRTGTAMVETVDEDGEVAYHAEDVPGLGMVEGAPTLAVTTTDAAEAAALAMLRGPLALEVGHE